MILYIAVFKNIIGRKLSSSAILLQKVMYGFENQETYTFQIIRILIIDENLSIIWTSKLYGGWVFAQNFDMEDSGTLHIFMKKKNHLENKLQWYYSFERRPARVATHKPNLVL